MRYIHHEGKLTHHHEGNLPDAKFPSIMKEILLMLTFLLAFRKTVHHHEGNVTDANFPSIVKESTRTSQLSTTMLHCEGMYLCIAKNNYIAS